MKVLVVGLGNIAQRHIRNLKALEPSIEVAVWRQRPDPEGWQPPEGLPVDRWLTDLFGVLEFAPHAVIMANPASMRAVGIDMADALRAHMFIEKPISSNPVTARLLTEKCERFGLVCYIGYDLRHYRPLQLVKAALDAGRIGRPLSIHCEVGQYLPDWRPGRDYRTSVSARAELGGGVILELSHEIDYARWLMGEVVSVAAMTGRLSDLEIDTEDTADLLLRFESGAQGSIHLDMTDRTRMRTCRIVGSEGTLTCDLITGEAWLYGDDQVWRLVCPVDGTAGPEAMEAEIAHFLACCRGEAVPPVDGVQGKRVLEIALAAKRSAEEGRVVCL